MKDTLIHNSKDSNDESNNLQQNNGKGMNDENDEETINDSVRCNHAVWNGYQCICC